MKVHVYPDRQTMSRAAARHAAATLQRVIRERGIVRVVAATAASQLDFQRELVRADFVDWSRVELFQLDEYIGLPDGHPASFRAMLRANLAEPAGITRVHAIEGGDPALARDAMNRRIAGAPLDLAVLGIGENAHLAFNDPPADFETRQPYIVVALDEACRQQQVGEGWFARLEDVPTTAVSMSIREMLSAREIVVVVPDRRKAEAVRAALEAAVSPAVPASILRTHPNATLYLDEAAASLLDPTTRSAHDTRP
jgi:glucosamine-6-phosphate deaminase